MEAWKKRTLSETAKREPNEQAYLRTVLLLIQSSDGRLESVVEVEDAWPGMGTEGCLHFDAGQQLSIAQGRHIAQSLFTGMVEPPSPVEFWHCSACNWEVIDAEGDCQGCGEALELTGRSGPAPGVYVPQRETSLPTPGDELEKVGYSPLLNRLWRNWPVHNLFAHPLHEILFWLGLRTWAETLHDGTVPQDFGGR